MAYSGQVDTYKIFKEGRNIGIQLAHRFLVEFTGLDNLDIFKQKDIKEYFPIYVKNVKFPMYNFKKETFQSGPFDRVFPVLDNNGMELTIEFIEDSDGFMSAFISSLQSRIFKNGTHRIGIESTFGIRITTFDSYANKISSYQYYGCYYLKSEAITLDYEAVDKLTYNVTFLCNRYEIKVEPKAPIPTATIPIETVAPPKYVAPVAPDLNNISQPPEGSNIFGNRQF